MEDSVDFAIFLRDNLTNKLPERPIRWVINISLRFYNNSHLGCIIVKDKFITNNLWELSNILNQNKALH